MIACSEAVQEEGARMRGALLTRPRSSGLQCRFIERRLEALRPLDDRSTKIDSI